MRAIFVGAGSLTQRTAKNLAARGHEIVIVERDQAIIEAVSGELDCGLLHGDGTRPLVLREADPANSDVLLTLTGNDQTNLIASLVGRSLGFPRVITRIDEEEFEHIGMELGLEDTIIPARTIGRHLADMVEGQDILELSAAIKGDARIFMFVARQGEECPVGELDLPKGARVTHLYRGDALVLADADTALEAGDEVVVLARRDALAAIRERFGSAAPDPRRAGASGPLPGRR